MITQVIRTAEEVNVEEHLGKTNQENTRCDSSVNLTVVGTDVSAQPHLIKGGGGGGRWKICRDTAPFLLFANPIRCATGLIRPEMRSSRRRRPLGRARTRREVSKTGFF